MGKGYRQAPGKGGASKKRKDGGRIAGQQDFGVPGSGGASPHSNLQDLDHVPSSVGGWMPQPRGPHVHDRHLTGTTIGKSVPLIDANWKVTGQAEYGDDIRLPGELIGKILRSPHHHALVKSVDTTAAEAMEGVFAVATGADSENSFGVLPVTKDEHAMAREKVRHVGDLVACVAAIDEATAIQAMHAITVDYEVLPSIHDMEDGLLDSEHPIHDRGKYHVGESNVQKRVFQQFGDLDGMAAAPYRHEADWETAGVHHGFTEPHAVVAHWDPSGRLTLWSPQQVPHYLHRALSSVLDIPMHQINVHRTFVGGGFGGKSDPFPHEMCAAILARKCGRPVRINFDREEVYWINRGRHPSRIQMGVFADEEGRIAGIETDALIDGGAFASFGHVTTYYNGVLHTSPYEIGGFHYTGARVWTNKPASGAMRGHGAVNSRCAVEVGIDAVCEQMNVDPMTFRLANLLPPHSRTITGFRITSTGMRECLAKVREMSGWDEKFRNLPLGRGIGVGCGFFISGSGLPIHWDPENFPHATVHLQCDMDGGVTVHTGAAEIGQGSDTAIAQAVSEVLALPLDMIRIRSKETDTAPVDLGSYSSRVTFMNANAAIRAAGELRDKVMKAAWEITGYHPDVLVIGDRRIYYRHDPAIGVSWLEAVHKAQADSGALIASGAYRTPPMGGVHKGAAAGLAPAYSFSAYVAEVEVDVETGFTKVIRAWAAHDCGKALNPLAVKGQIIGSCHMGMGQALSEEMKYGRDGHLMNPDLLDFKIMSVHEMPEVIPIIVESNDPEGPFGAKEAGEGPLLPILPAVCNAIHDAIGIRIDEMPVTPDRLYKRIEQACKAQGVDDPLDLANPTYSASALQTTLAERAEAHALRDHQRDIQKDRSSYVNGVLFGFDPDIPPSEQIEGWRESITPSPEDLVDETKRAARAWSHVERRHRGDA